MKILDYRREETDDIMIILETNEEIDNLINCLKQLKNSPYNKDHFHADTYDPEWVILTFAKEFKKMKKKKKRKK